MELSVSIFLHAPKWPRASIFPLGTHSGIGAFDDSHPICQQSIYKPAAAGLTSEGFDGDRRRPIRRISCGLAGGILDTGTTRGKMKWI